MVSRHRVFMFVSGLLGLIFFIIANLDLVGNDAYFAYAQLCINAFVFLSWGIGYLKATSSFEKFVAFWGVIVPILMAVITVINVLT